MESSLDAHNSSNSSINAVAYASTSITAASMSAESTATIPLVGIIWLLRLIVFQPSLSSDDNITDWATEHSACAALPLVKQNPICL